MSRTVWDVVEEGLNYISADRFCEDLGEVKLLISLIVSGGKDRDLEYLNSDNFLYHCQLARLDSDLTMNAIKNAWFSLDNKIPVNLTPFEESKEEDFL